LNFLGLAGLSLRLQFCRYTSVPATFFNSTKSGNVAPFGTESTFSASTSLRMTNGCGPLGLGLPGVPPFTEKQIEALDLFKATVRELAFDMEFRQGDIQFLQNQVILHSRRGFEDWPEPERRRHLLRLWVSDDAGRAVPPVYRKIISGINVEGVEPKTPLDVDA